MNKKKKWFDRKTQRKYSKILSPQKKKIKHVDRFIQNLQSIKRFVSTERPQLYVVSHFRCISFNAQEFELAWNCSRTNHTTNSISLHLSDSFLQRHTHTHTPKSAHKLHPISNQSCTAFDRVVVCCFCVAINEKPNGWISNPKIVYRVRCTLACLRLLNVH